MPVIKDIPKIRFLEETARSAGRILMRHLSKLKKGQIQFKGANDYVTEVDRLSEKMIIRKILKSFPGHEILAEESGHTGPRTPDNPLWVIDPLDGTTNFIHEFPIFCVSIALQVQGETILAVIFDPTRDELFSASRGQGAYLNHKKIKVSPTKNLKDSLLSTGFPFLCHEVLEDYIQLFRVFCKNSRGIRRAGSAALDLCYLASGRFDGFWEFGLHPWDIAAGSLIVEEAGGLITNFEGKPLELKAQNILAGNKFIHKQLREQVQFALE